MKTGKWLNRNMLSPHKAKVTSCGGNILDASTGMTGGILNPYLLRYLNCSIAVGVLLREPQRRWLK